MKKLVTLGLYGLLVFAASAASAWFVNSAKTQSEAEVAGGQGSAEKEAKPTPSIINPRQPMEATVDEESPVAVRPQKMNVEEIVRYGLSLKSRELAMNERENALQRVESQQQLVLADIEAEQKELEGLLAQARDQRAATGELLKDVRQTQIETEQKKQEIDAGQERPGATSPTTEKDRDANIKDLTEIVQSMDPDKAAGVLKEFANNGKSDMAVEILSKLEQRKAATILTAMDDDPLVSELLEKCALVKRPEPATKRR